MVLRVSRGRRGAAALAALLWSGLLQAGAGAAGAPGLGPDPSATPAPRCLQPPGRVLRVGPGEAFAVPSAAAAAARPGDTVWIAAGDYRGDVAVWRADDLALCGDPGGVNLHADGQHAEGKAIWVIKGSPVLVDGIAFHGARVPDRNGAGIRQEGRELTLRRSGFFDNENGLLSSNRPDAWIRIEHGTFARNGHGDGYSHNLYVGRIARLEVWRSAFREARAGHQLKSRAAINRIDDSHFADGPTGQGSYLLDFPNGGQAVLRGNRLDKTPLSANGAAISFGTEGAPHQAMTLELEGNRLEVDHPAGAALQVVRQARRVRLTGNDVRLAGRAVLLRGGFDAAAVETGTLAAPAEAASGRAGAPPPTASR